MSSAIFKGDQADLVGQIGTGTWFPPTLDIYRSMDEPSVEEDPVMREGG